MGEPEPVEFDGEVAHVGDAHGVFQGIGHVGEEVAHLLGSLEVQGVIGHLEPLLVLDGGVGLDAEENVLDRGLIAVDVVDVVGRDQGNFQVPAHPYEALVDWLQHVEIVALDFEVVVLEDLAVPSSGGIGIIHPAFPDGPRNLRGRTPG